MKKEGHMFSNKALRIAVIGAGIRGTSLARKLPLNSNIEVIAVAEPNSTRRIAFAEEFNLSESQTFKGWDELIGSQIDCDAAIIATLDNQHTAPTIACLQQGWHILLEKPLADTFQDCLDIEKAQRESGNVLAVCHTLRFMDSFRTVKNLLEKQKIGEIIHIEHMEGISHKRFAHNYVRGRWGTEENNTFLLLHKCCHDIDYLCWLIKSDCLRVSSFGSLKFFTPDNALEGSSPRCLDCSHNKSCVYSATNLYTEGTLDEWPARDVARVHTTEEHMKAIKYGPYGACVWHAGNDVVDHQVVMMEFSNGVTATSTLSGYSATNGRRLRIQGTKGELLYDEAIGKIIVKKFPADVEELIEIKAPQSYHPEDKDIVDDWLSSINSSELEVAVDVKEAIRTHAVVFAAELSRHQKKTIELSDFYKEFNI